MATAQLIDPATTPDHLMHEFETLLPAEQAQPSVTPVDLRRQALGRCWGA